MSPNVNPLDTTKRQVKNSTSQLRGCCLRSSYDFPQSPEHCSPTKYARVSRCSHGNVAMLLCTSFTQSERFLQTDQLIIRLQVVVVTNFIRMLMRNVFVNVFESDAVIWLAAIFRSFPPSSLFGGAVSVGVPLSFLFGVVLFSCLGWCCSLFFPSWCCSSLSLLLFCHSIWRSVVLPPSTSLRVCCRCSFWN